MLVGGLSPADVGCHGFQTPWPCAFPSSGLNTEGAAAPHKKVNVGNISIMFEYVKKSQPFQVDGFLGFQPSKVIYPMIYPILLAVIRISQPSSDRK